MTFKNDTISRKTNCFRGESTTKGSGHESPRRILGPLSAQRISVGPERSRAPVRRSLRELELISWKTSDLLVLSVMTKRASTDRESLIVADLEPDSSTSIVYCTVDLGNFVTVNSKLS